MTHSREALLLKGVGANWAGQARRGRGEVSSCTSHSQSEEPGQATSGREHHLALGLEMIQFPAEE